MNLELEKNFMETIFVPALHKMIKSKNPTEYEKWQGNLCRQTAIFGALILSTINNDVDWQVWDGIFEDIYCGKRVTYNHAWIFGKDKNTGQRYLVDLSRNHKERLFIEVNSNRYPRDHEEYKDMREVSRNKLDWESMLSEKEYFTNLDGKEFMNELQGYIAVETSLQ